MQWRWGWNPSSWFQVCRTPVNPIVAFSLVAGDLDEGLGDGLEEEGQAHLGRPAEERVKLLWDGEDDLEVRGGQEQGFLRVGPQRLLQNLALGAVPIPTGIVGAAGEAAVGTQLEMPAQPLSGRRRYRPRPGPGVR